MADPRLRDRDHATAVVGHALMQTIQSLSETIGRAVVGQRVGKRLHAVVELRNAGKLTDAEIAVVTGLRKKQVQCLVRCARIAGQEVRPSTKPPTQRRSPIASAIIRVWNAGGMTRKEVSAHYGVAEGSIARILCDARRRGVAVRMGQSGRPQKEAQEISVRMWNAGEHTQGEIAKIIGISLRCMRDQLARARVAGIEVRKCKPGRRPA